MATTEELTLTRLLSSLKQLDQKVKDYLTTNHLLVYVGMGDSKVNIKDNRPVEEMTRLIQAEHDTIDTVLARQLALQRALKRTNAVTKVSLYNVEMTIQEALVEKHLLPHKKSLLTLYKNAMSESLRLCASQQEEFRKRVDVLSEATIGKETTGTNAELRTLELAKLVEQQRQTWGPSVVDPMKLGEKITKLQNEISEIELELDERLSVINATTTVTVTY